MNKFSIVLVVVLLLVGGVYYIDYDSDKQKENINLEEKLKDPIALQEEYGGGVIVSYDTETGEITRIRRQDYTVMPKEGALSITSDEADKIGRENLPKNVVIIPSDKTYYEILRNRKS